jgi:hypothetical protein
MTAPQRPQTIIVIGPGLIPPGPQGVSLGNVPPEILRKYASPKPLRRPRPRPPKQK